MKIPYVKKIKKKWIMKEFNKYLSESNRVPTQEEFVDIVKKEYRVETKRQLNLRVSVKLTEEQAMALASCESMNACLEYRNPDTPEECPISAYQFCIARKEWKCRICLGTETDRQVKLKVCSCTYHRKCIRKSYIYSHKCPICDASIISRERPV